MSDVRRAPRARTRLPASAAALLAACAGGAPAPTGEISPETPALLEEIRRFELDVPGVTGLSDLARDGQGRLWAVAERVRSLVRIDRPAARPTLVPILGVPEGLDIEGLAWLPDGRAVFATEADAGVRSSDALFFATVTDEVASVVDRRDLDYSLWPLEPIGNQGIEGLCRADTALVLAIETVIVDGNERFAPIAVHDLSSGSWSPHRVRLTTRTGKISAVACRALADHGIDVLAVERHFEVARLIRFKLPPSGAAGVTLEPVLVADLAPVLERQENYEGLVWDGARAFALVADNDWTHVTGPNLLVTARLAGPPPIPR